MKILIVDDHVLIRDALRSILKELAADAELIDAAHADEARRLLAAEAQIELVLLDLLLPDASGFDVLTELRASHPGIAVVVLSACVDRNDISRALELGALGFIPKSASRQVMLGALELIFAGGVYVPPEILNAGPANATAPPAALPSIVDSGLTERQLEVLDLMMRGQSNKAICRELDIAEATVKSHVSAILRALKARNRTEAVVAAASRFAAR